MERLVDLVAGAAILLPAIAGLGRARAYVWMGFVALILGGLMIVSTPTPLGYNPDASSIRPIVSSRIGEDASAVLFVVGACALIGALLVSWKPADDHTHHTGVPSH
ncbi:MAG: hypothetical protein R2712_17225 [Vicinamibacterales bacterium]